MKLDMENKWVNYDYGFIHDIIIEVTYANEKGYKAVYEIMGRNENQDFVLRMISEEKANEQKKEYFGNERVIAVDPMWFYAESKRIIKRIS